ncbi:hypothetical protein DL771_009661 [Monosporascus sp. 5C6A]|nr:hypothetical protein DL771_009661 [Monosporascus sp. 5C6A]
MVSQQRQPSSRGTGPAATGYRPPAGVYSTSADLNKIVRFSYGPEITYQRLATEAAAMWDEWNGAVAAGPASAAVVGEGKGAATMPGVQRLDAVVEPGVLRSKRFPGSFLLPPLYFTNLRTRILRQPRGVYSSQNTWHNQHLTTRLIIPERQPTPGLAVGSRLEFSNFEPQIRRTWRRRVFGNSSSGKATKLCWYTDSTDGSFFADYVSVRRGSPPARTGAGTGPSSSRSSRARSSGYSREGEGGVAAVAEMRLRRGVEVEGKQQRRTGRAERPDEGRPRPLSSLSRR